MTCPRVVPALGGAVGVARFGWFLNYVVLQRLLLIALCYDGLPLVCSWTVGCGVGLCCDGGYFVFLSVVCVVVVGVWWGMTSGRVEERHCGGVHGARSASPSLGACW